jgi:hypothetical protein
MRAFVAAAKEFHAKVKAAPKQPGNESEKAL